MAISTMDMPRNRKRGITLRAQYEVADHDAQHQRQTDTYGKATRYGDGGHQQHIGQVEDDARGESEADRAQPYDREVVLEGDLAAVGAKSKADTMQAMTPKA